MATSVLAPTVKIFSQWKLTVETINRLLASPSLRMLHHNWGLLSCPGQIATKTLLIQGSPRVSLCRSHGSLLRDRQSPLRQKRKERLNAASLTEFDARPIITKDGAGLYHRHGRWFSSSPSGGNTLNACTDSDELAEKIIAATRETDIMTESLPKDAVKNLVEQLQAQSFNQKNIKNLLSGRLWLLERPDLTASLTHHLLEHGFLHTTVCQLIRAVPYDLRDALDTLPQQISQMMFFLGNMGLSERDVISILNSSPSILYSDVNTVAKAVSKLRSFFPMKDVHKLIRKSPSLLGEEWSDVLRKYRYVIFSMVYSKEDIVGSHLFSHSLEHLKNRHLFLVRAGCFATISHKLNPALNPNPTLINVVDTTDRTFLGMFPFTDLEGYRVFCEMRTLEQEIADELGLEELMDDNDEDEDDDGDDDDYIDHPNDFKDLTSRRREPKKSFSQKWSKSRKL